MEIGQLAEEVTWTTVLAIVVGGYALAVAAFLILENRSPQSMFAWLFLLLVFPLGGLLIYSMFGRSRHVFSRERSLLKLLEGTALADRAAAVLAEQPAKLAALADRQPEHARLASMLWASARSPLTFGNHIEILQDATEKYSRLIADLRTATRSIHLLYYEWASDAFTEQVGKLLAEKAAQGVDVRILYDPVGSLFMLSRDLRASAAAAGHRDVSFFAALPAPHAQLSESS
jgi:cardiolipin synthase